MIYVASLTCNIHATEVFDAHKAPFLAVLLCWRSWKLQCQISRKVMLNFFLMWHTALKYEGDQQKCDGV